jgi:hypothetical protein
MRSIERRFEIFKKKNPYWSDIICFNTAVAHQKFKRRYLRHWFKKLVKDDYEPRDKKEILAHTEELTNMPENDKNESEDNLQDISNPDEEHCRQKHKREPPPDEDDLLRMLDDN